MTKHECVFVYLWFVCIELLNDKMMKKKKERERGKGEEAWVPVLVNCDWLLCIVQFSIG